MRRLFITLTVSLMLVANAVAAQAAPRVWTAHLSGGQEVMPVETRATGQAVLRVARDGESIAYTLIVANIEDVSMAHLHLAPAGENGPVVTWLYPEDGPPPELIEGRSSGILARGTITADDLVGPFAGADLDALLEAITAGEIYVNVHTTANPGGEVRGQAG